MHTYYIVPCSQTKRPTSVWIPARELYIGGAFKIASARLDSLRRPWIVLSALYGFVSPAAKIETYEKKMEPLQAGQAWDDCFEHISMRAQLELQRSSNRVVVLGSKLYADAAAVLLGRPVEAPVAGLPIGRMLSALKTLAL